MATVLFHFKAEAATHVFLELKRPQFKDQEIMSKYVSWFMVQVAEPRLVTRLTFVSWEGNIRTFEQGVLTSSETEATFVVAATGETITATAASIDEDEDLNSL